MELSPAEAQKAVQELLRQPGNNICADCHAPSPTWASVNLGVFICLDCSAHHRAMGTHISKVKSTTLDKWNAQMVESLRRAGNSKANAYWEKGLPPNTPRPTTSDARGTFIRQKYEQGKFRNELPAVQQQATPVAASVPVTPAKPAQASPSAAHPAAAAQASGRRRRAPPGSNPSTFSTESEGHPAAANGGGGAALVSNAAANSLDLLDLGGDEAGGHSQQAQAQRVTAPVASSFSFLSATAPPPPSHQPSNGHAPSMFESMTTTSAKSASSRASVLDFMSSSSPVQSMSPALQPTSAPNPRSAATVHVLEKANSQLDRISGRLKSIAASLEQLRGSGGQARVDIRPFFSGGELPFLQLNEPLYQKLSTDPTAMKHAADALRQCADALEAGASRAQASLIKDDLAAECAKLDALQMGTIDGLTGLDAQQMATRKAASVKVAALVNEAQLLHAKALIVLSGPSNSDQARPTLPTTGFGFMQQQPALDQAQGFSFMRPQASPQQIQMNQLPVPGLGSTMPSKQLTAPIPSFLG